MGRKEVQELAVKKQVRPHPGACAPDTAVLGAANGKFKASVRFGLPAEGSVKAALGSPGSPCFFRRLPKDTPKKPRMERGGD